MKLVMAPRWSAIGLGLLLVAQLPALASSYALQTHWRPAVRAAHCAPGQSAAHPHGPPPASAWFGGKGGSPESESEDESSSWQSKLSGAARFISNRNAAEQGQFVKVRR